jgi:hypothetical protein
MNPHVNRDMPFMLDALGLTKPDGSSRKPDHDRGNRVLAALYGPVLNEMDARFDDSISSYEVPGTWIDDAGFFQILQGWRELVWRHAEMLERAHTRAERGAVASYIETYALEQGRFIEANTRIRSSAARDAHCRACRRTHREHGGKGSVRLSRRATRSGAARVRVRCAVGIRDCAGTLALTRRGRPLAAGRRFSLAPARSRVERMRLRRTARRALTRRRGLLVKVTVRMRTPWGTTRSASRRARLRASR